MRCMRLLDDGRPARSLWKIEDSMMDFISKQEPLKRDRMHDLLPLALNETNLPLPGKHSGKVRDWYALPDGKRLLVTTDRLSAFDRNLACVPYKGQALNQL